MTMNKSSEKENKPASVQPVMSQIQLRGLWMRSANRLTTTFDTLSQKLRRSTRRREPLINSPGTPCKAKTTPVKMYSPFSIETPRTYDRPRPVFKNSSVRRSLNKPRKSAGKDVDTTSPPRNQDKNNSGLRMSPRLASELYQAQIGVYELEHTAKVIVDKQTST